MGGATGNLYHPINTITMNNGQKVPGPGDRLSFLSSLNDNDDDEVLKNAMKASGTANFAMTTGKK